MSNNVDIYVIKKMCKDLAKQGDYRTLASLVRTSKEVQAMCQKYLDKAKDSPQYYMWADQKYQQQVESDMKAIDEGRCTIHLYPKLMDETDVDFKALADGVLRSLHKHYGPKVGLKAGHDKDNNYYFELVGLGKTARKELVRDFESYGCMDYGDIEHSLTIIVEGRVAIEFTECLDDDPVAFY